MAFVPSKMQLTSSAFAPGGQIPTKHTGEGENVSPALAWQGAPEGTRAYALFCHDPDAPRIDPGSYGYVHWVVYNLPATTTSLAEGSREGTQGATDSGKAGYGGPMPPKGHGPHHYYFWLVALDDDTQLEPGLTLWQLLERIEPHVIAMNRLIGRYQRD